MWWRLGKLNLVPLGILVCLSLWAPVRKSEDGTKISRVAALAFSPSQTLGGEFRIDQEPPSLDPCHYASASESPLCLHFASP